jgi:CRP-like cAMP-binding protein
LRTVILNSLGKLVLFDNNQDFLEKAMCFFKLYTFQKNDIILEEGTQPLELFWIVQGTCKVLQTVPIVKKVVKRKVITRPYIFGNKVGENENVVHVQLETQELNSGDNFPYIPNLEKDSGTNALTALSLSKGKYVDFYNKMSVDEPLTFATCSVVAAMETTVAAIQFTDFVQIVPRDVLFSMITSPTLQPFTVQELQQQYMNHQSWNDHKKTVVDEIINRN